MTPEPNGPDRTRGPVLRLYVAGESPSSRRAIANLKAICATAFDDRCEVEVLDVLENAERALADGVLVTPTLIRITPPRRTIVGDLSHRAKVLDALGDCGA
jgi:circadian clock protein KaiB